MRKKIKKVIKGLQKASKTHAKQAGILKKAFKVTKLRGGGMDASKSDFSSGPGAVTSDAGFENTSKSKVSSNIGGGGGGGTKKPPKTNELTKKLKTRTMKTSQTQKTKFQA